MSKKRDRIVKVVRIHDALNSLGVDDGKCIKFNKRYIRGIKAALLEILADDGVTGMAADSKVEVSSAAK